MRHNHFFILHSDFLLFRHFCLLPFYFCLSPCCAPEQGRLAGVIRVLLGCAAAVALALLYLLVQFRGLSTETGMDQAQIAREVARGNGFSTKMIRPFAAQQLQDHTGRIPDTNFPDSFNAPLGPLVNSLVVLCLPGELTKKIGSGNSVFAGDRLVAASRLCPVLRSEVSYRQIAKEHTTTVLLAQAFPIARATGETPMILYARTFVHRTWREVAFKVA